MPSIHAFIMPPHIICHIIITRMNVLALVNLEYTKKKALFRFKNTFLNKNKKMNIWNHI